MRNENLNQQDAEWSVTWNTTQKMMKRRIKIISLEIKRVSKTGGTGGHFSNLSDFHKELWGSVTTVNE